MHPYNYELRVARARQEIAGSKKRQEELLRCVSFVTVWQGKLQHLHAMRFAAHVAKRELAACNIDPASFDTGVVA